MNKREAITKRNTRLRAELEAALERVRSVEVKNKWLEEELLRQEHLVLNLSEAQDRDTETIGILADVVDILFEDEDRCATRSYDSVLEKAKELVGLKKDAEYWGRMYAAELLRSQRALDAHSRARSELAELREAERFVLCVWCGEEICSGGTLTPEDVLDRCRAHDEGCEANPLRKQLRAIPGEMARLEFWPMIIQPAVEPFLPGIVARAIDAAQFIARRGSPPAAVSDTQRLDWLLSFASVEDVGDEECVAGVCFRCDDMESELLGSFECETTWPLRQVIRKFIDEAIRRSAARAAAEG